MGFLASKGPKASTFVTASLVQLLCRITKLGWYEDERFKEIVKDATSFLSQVRKTRSLDRKRASGDARNTTSGPSL